MAVLLRFPLLFLFVLTLTPLLLLTSPAYSLNCSSQKFTTNNLYTNCTDLPTLNASLHWTHVAGISSLSIAFVAPPEKPDGWISWAINPTQTGMVGSQAFIAFKDSNGTMTVKTYNISSYSSIVEGKISFDVRDLRAEYSAGSMKVFATVKLPEKMTEVNHLWQVGSSVVKGTPAEHEFLPANLKAVGKLQLKLAGKVPSNGTTINGSSMITPSTNSASSNNEMYVFLMFLIGALILN